MGENFPIPRRLNIENTCLLAGQFIAPICFIVMPDAHTKMGACEVNHELIRWIIPKETSMEYLTQEDIFLMMDHINSYKRKKLNNRSPYETFNFLHGEDVLEALGCREVAAKDILLKPVLLKNK